MLEKSHFFHPMFEMMKACPLYGDDVFSNGR